MAGKPVCDDAKTRICKGVLPPWEGVEGQTEREYAVCNAFLSGGPVVNKLYEP